MEGEDDINAIFCVFYVVKKQIVFFKIFLMKEDEMKVIG